MNILKWISGSALKIAALPTSRLRDGAAASCRGEASARRRKLPSDLSAVDPAEEEAGPKPKQRNRTSPNPNPQSPSDESRHVNNGGASVPARPGISPPAMDNSCVNNDGASLPCELTHPTSSPPIENRKSQIENGGDVILNDIAATLSRFVTVPEPALVAASLFVLHTYAFNLGNISPTLFITGNSRRCGKSKFLRILSRLVSSPLIAGSVSTRALYRDIELHSHTLCFDDVDTCIRNKDQLRALIHSSDRDLAFHLGCARGADRQLELQRLSTWTPRIFTGTGRIADSLRDSAITIQMARHPNAGSRESLRRETRFERLHARMLRFVEDHREAIRTANPSVPDNVRDQSADHWAPLLALADLAGGDWPEKARRAAIALSGDQGSNPSGEADELIADIRQVFLDQYVRTMSSRDLANHLADLKGRPWSEYGTLRRPLTQTQLADLLREHGIAPHTVRIGNRTPRGYVFSDFKDAYRRLLAQNSTIGCNTATSPVNIDQNADSEGATDPTICSFDDTDWSDIDPQKPLPKIVIPPEELAELQRLGEELLAREALEKANRLQTASLSAIPNGGKVAPAPPPTPNLNPNLNPPPPSRPRDGAAAKLPSDLSAVGPAEEEAGPNSALPSPSPLDEVSMDPWTRALLTTRRQIEERNQPGYKPPLDPYQAALEQVRKLTNPH